MRFTTLQICSRLAIRPYELQLDMLRLGESANRPSWNMSSKHARKEFPSDWVLLDLLLFVCCQLLCNPGTTTNVDTELATVHIIQSMCAIWNGDWGFGVFSIQFGEEEDTIEVTVRVSSLSSLTSVKFHFHPSVIVLFSRRDTRNICTAP